MHRVAEDAEIADTITRICIDVKARMVLKSGEQMIAALKGLDESLESAGIEIETAVQPRTDDTETAARNEAEHRTKLFEADVGITGSDYAIAETGTVVVHPRSGLSRLVSLAPPRHIAVVRRGNDPAFARRAISPGERSPCKRNARQFNEPDHRSQPYRRH